MRDDHRGGRSIGIGKREKNPEVAEGAPGHPTVTMISPTVAAATINVTIDMTMDMTIDMTIEVAIDMMIDKSCMIRIG